MPRLFIAVDIPKEQISALVQLRDDHLDARWTPSNHYHLTLRFVGNVDEERVDKLATALGEIESSSLIIEGSGLDVFPSRRRPRVLVARVDSEPDLSQLQEAVDRMVVGMGLPKERKPFNPHVTLARIKGATPREVRSFMMEHTDFRLEPFRAGAFHLYRSDLGPGGAVHTVLRTYSFNG